MDTTIPQKPCTRCGESMPLTDFYPRSDSKGLTSWCKFCYRQYHRDVYWQDKTPRTKKQKPLRTKEQKPLQHHYARNYNAGFFVYLITNQVNRLQYVGCTTAAISKRWEGHRNAMYQTEHSWKPLYQDMLKYGIEQFTIGLIAECTSKFTMRQQETRSIWQHNTIWPHGYNL